MSFRILIRTFIRKCWAVRSLTGRMGAVPTWGLCRPDGGPPAGKIPHASSRGARSRLMPTVHNGSRIVIPRKIYVPSSRLSVNADPALKSNDPERPDGYAITHFGHWSMCGDMAGRTGKQSHPDPRAQATTSASLRIAQGSEANDGRARRAARRLRLRQRGLRQKVVKTPGAVASFRPVPGNASSDSVVAAFGSGQHLTCIPADAGPGRL
jgi:hypothetical protein